MVIILKILLGTKLELKKNKDNLKINLVKFYIFLKKIGFIEIF